MKKIYKKLILVISLLGLMVLAASCSSSKSASKDNSVKKIQDKGTLVVGTSADFAPFEFPIVKDGQKQIVGYDMMIAKKIAQALHVKLKIQNEEFSSLITDLRGNKIDLIIAGLSVTKQREKYISFSKPYYKATDVLLVRKGNAEKYDSVKSLVGKSIGVQQSSTQETEAKKRFKKSNLIVESAVTNMSTELSQGKLDGIVVGQAIATEYVAKFPDKYSIAKVKIPVKKDAQTNNIGIRKGDNELKKRVNKVITQLQKNGEDTKMFNEAKQLQDKYGK
ncbi:MAG: transporter substrate-binding domain-containing protein [Liquorilactobacillus hordei]|uniref:ABC transporter substrate-binding protein n=1 Tax=Liquorilactobacillus satsumensis DSM 16230 = JCM 12392 TaxID=1423801 RepID=A0A0R1VBV8_9LACO|nr:transporter substrate-binding domain-containing protein [Liquorilactobacillus satsumensis]KRM00467.1 ABC transporter substrate-binding protein [Liquorilactobacillus satsumensis DSM 16230 = JCM 12392]MCC7667907.1 glutamate ABC transporter substrate-binding protein [Liquorilactobacillus satsumensis]MCP9329841.1 transporter substrate-binding domain-containing protein [Liquorilactobacillus satsumensis]MCP9358772.1 transporter substrate-binding domain-containing protein [Liquorilactobacillus sats